MSKQPVVIVDTTTTFSDVMMAGTRWTQVLSLCAKKQLRVVVPTVVLQEAARHWDEQAQKTLTRLLQAPKSLADLGLEEFDLPAVVHGMKVDPDAYLKKAVERLSPLGVEILPLPNVGVADVLSRDLARKKPFAKSGKGFRDALIWHAAKELLATLPSQTLVYFVSNNTEDYSKDGELHPDLLSEIDDLDLDMRYVTTLDQLLASDAVRPLVEKLSPSPQELERFLRASIEQAEIEDYEPSIGDVIREAIDDVVADLTGEEISTGIEYGSGLDFSDVFFPHEMEAPSIGYIQIEPNSLEWDAYETYEEETLLVRATVDADVEIEGFVFKADYYGIEGDVSLIEFDWNKHYALVGTSVPARLVFQLRLEAGTRLVEDIEFEMAENLIASGDG